MLNLKIWIMKQEVFLKCNNIENEEVNNLIKNDLLELFELRKGYSLF